MLRGLMYALLCLGRKRTVYVLTQKRLDDQARCVASTQYEGIALIMAYERALAAHETKSGTAVYLHCIEVPRRLDSDQAYLWAQDRIVQPNPGEGVRTNDHHVVTNTMADDILLLVDAR